MTVRRPPSLTDPNEPELLPPPSNPLVEGRVLGGRYVVKERIGAGGMGIVYRVFDRKLGEEVALKVIRAEVPETAADRRRPLREALLARRVTHANVCRVHDVDEREGFLFMTMELVPGTSLRALLRAGPLPLPRALHLWEQIARGVAAAHEQGIVHRDLKPENVLVQPDDRAKVADFGLATGAGLDSVTSGIVGTRAYMSPEQHRGEALDVRTDVFSLGIIGHELLTGRHPSGEGSPAVSTAAIPRDPAQPTVAPAPAAAVVARAMANRREERFASAGALLDAIVELRRTLSPPSSKATPITATSPERGQPRAASFRRAPWMILAAMLVVAVLVVLAVGPGPSPPPESPRVVVSTFSDLARSPWSAVLARSAEGSIRAELRGIKGVSVADAAEQADWVVHGSIQGADQGVRIQIQIDTGPNQVGLPFEVGGTNDSQLLDALGDRVIDEVRLLLRDHERRVAAARETRNDAARKSLLAYYDLMGLTPQPEHLQAGKQLLDSALTADPSYVSARIARGYLLLLQASMTGDRNDLDAVRSDLEALHELAPADARCAVLRCRWARFSMTFETEVSDESLEEVTAICNDAVTVAPDSAPVHVDLAKLHQERCDRQQAIRSLERALSLDRSKAGEVLRHLAELAFETGNLPLADDASKRLVELQKEEERLGPAALSARAGIPRTRGAHWLRGSILLRRGDHKEALAAFKDELAEPHPDDLLVEAASIRGLLRAAPPDEGTAVSFLQQLSFIESKLSTKAEQEPSVALSVAGAYMFTDPRAAHEWLDRLGKPATCNEAIYRALVHQVAGDATEARRVIAMACKSATGLERRCADSLVGLSQ